MQHQTTGQDLLAFLQNLTPEQLALPVVKNYYTPETPGDEGNDDHYEEISDMAVRTSYHGLKAKQAIVIS